MTTEEEENTELISSTLFGSKNFKNHKNHNRIKFANSNNVIFKHCKHKMQINYNSITLILLIFFISATHFINSQVYDGQNSEFLPVKSKTKRSTSEDGSQLSRQQQSFSISIPAANPNFEAAFQGECGKNNNSNPCEHICLDLHDGTYECSCFYGFALAVDGYSCASLDKSASSTTSSSITSTTLLPTKKQLNKAVEGDLREEGERVGEGKERPISNPYKVENLPLKVSSKVEITERRGLDFSYYNERDNNNTTTKANRNTSNSSSGFTEIDQTRVVGGQQQLLLKLQAQAKEHGRVSDSRKLAAELAKGANLKDNEIANQVGGENKKSEADYSEVKAKVGGVSEVDVSASKRRRQRRLLNTAAAWIRQKVAAHSITSNQDGDSNYSNNISGRNDDGNNYNDSSPPNEESYLVQAQQQNTSYQLSEESPVPSKVAKEADIVEASNTNQELEPPTTTTRATITEKEGLMPTSDTVARYSNNNDNNNNNKVVVLESGYTNNWPKYELDADQDPDLHQYIKFPASNEQEHESDNINDNNNNNYNEYDDFLVDGDIKSIMISNDKLVKHLADLVSFAGQAIDGGDNQDEEDDYDDDDEEEGDQDGGEEEDLLDKTMGKSVSTDSDVDQERRITFDRRQVVAVKNKSKKAGQKRKIGGSSGGDDGNSNNEMGNKEDGEEEGGVDESLDYNLNLLEDLVRKTFEDYARKSGTSFLLDQITKPPTSERSASYQINRTISTEPNQSSSSISATENGSRARRSSNLRRQLTARLPVNRRRPTTEQFDIGGVSGERIRSLNEDHVDESGRPNNGMRDEKGGSYQGGGGGEGNPSFKKNHNNQNELPYKDSSTAHKSDPKRGVPELSSQDTQENSIKENINDRLCIDETDNNDNNDNDNFQLRQQQEQQQQYKNCLDMPECESGGKCITETKWFIPNPNKNFDFEYLTRPRCQCPIGRGGYLCQKPIQRKVPRFSGKSYLALPMIKDSSLSNLHFLFKPFGHSNLEKEETSLLLYSEKFLLLLDDLSRVELRYITQESGNKITRVIGSRDAEINRWNELLITNDASSDDLSQIETNLILPEIPMMNRIVLVVPDEIQLLEQQKQNYEATTTTTNNTHSMELFVAGVPDAFRTHRGAIKRQHSSLTMDKENLIGFSGCIRELSINKRAYNFRSDLNGDTLDGFDIGECCKEN